jgi:glycosyltransferase involved in cell wall biosynthesis
VSEAKAPSEARTEARNRGPNVCMIAYANYFTDARIRNYVEALLRKGYQVDVFALGQHKGAQMPGLRVFSVQDKHWGSGALGYLTAQLSFALLTTLLVAWRFLQRRYGLVHVHNMPNFLVFCALVPKLAGAKVILDVHDTMPESYATKFGLPLAHPLIALLRFEEWLSAKFADQVITTNELHKETLRSHAIPAEKIEIIMNVANERIFRPLPRKELPSGEASAPLVLAYHGTIAERLGIDLILRGVRIALDDCPNLRLLLIGDGDFLPTVRSLTQELGLSEHVKLVGFVPVDELPGYLADADVGVIGNRAYIEAKRNYMLPVKMLEYAGMEIPTIAPRLRVISRYFDDQSALFYTPDDARDMARRIVEVYRDRSKLDGMRLHLRAFNERYNWCAMERRYLGIVERLVEPAARVGAE